MEGLEQLAGNDPRVKTIAFGRNFGQTAALTAGFDHASGEIILPFDGICRTTPRIFQILQNWKKDSMCTSPAGGKTGRTAG